MTSTFQLGTFTVNIVGAFNILREAALRVQDGGAIVALTTSLVRHAYASRYNASSVLEAFGADPNDDLGIFDEATSIRRLVEDAYWSSPETGRWHQAIRWRARAAPASGSSRRA